MAKKDEQNEICHVLDGCEEEIGKQIVRNADNDGFLYSVFGKRGRIKVRKGKYV